MSRIERLLGDVKKNNDMALLLRVFYEHDGDTICLEQKEWDGYKQSMIIYPKDIPDIITLLDKEYQKWLNKEKK